MRALPLVLILLLVACDAGPLSDEAPVEVGGVSLTASNDAYGARDVVRVVLRNGGPLAVETGACASLERWTGAAWTPVDRDDVCIAIAIRMAPGETYEKSVRLDVPGGSYRVVDGVWAATGGETVIVATAAFRVE